MITVEGGRREYLQEFWSRVTGGLSKYYTSDIANEGCVSARLVSLRLAAVGKQFF